ncbi:NlpC/P60 family protein [Lewinella sp. LCG006]|uniref:C40 family peptidase n=1 Tax=Lewinella sp. LCG006 TaxID=3231911 RepID=UPI003460A969
MSRYSFLVFSFFLLTVGCGTPTIDPWPPALGDLVQGITSHFVPDRRVNRMEVEGMIKEDGKLYLTGETTLQKAKDSLLNALAAVNYQIVDSIKVLPAADLGDATYALSRHSVANLRSEKGHSQELATQVLLGTPLRVLKQDEEWFFVQCPDGYLAWLHGGELVRMTAAEMNEWKTANRVIFTAENGYSYQVAATEGRRVGDLVKGDILVSIDTEGKFTKVLYPDGREAYVLSEALASFASWLDKVSPSFSLTSEIAKAQLGKPYLWGGTSPKAMDCSGFTKTVYWQQGLIIPRDASQQVEAGQPVEYNENLKGLQAGDFLFFGRLREDGSQKITHVGIYLGDGAFIHSGSDNGANAIQQLLPDQPGYAPHRRESLLRAKRLKPETTGVQRVANHPWYW